MSTLESYAQRALHMMDLTSLTDIETAEDIIKLCKTATAKLGVYLNFISDNRVLVRHTLDKPENIKCCL